MAFNDCVCAWMVEKDRATLSFMDIDTVHLPFRHSCDIETIVCPCALHIVQAYTPLIRKA